MSQISSFSIVKKGLVKRNYDKLNEALESLMQKFQCETKDELLKIYEDTIKVNKPKYIFLNTLLLRKKNIKKMIKRDEYTEVKE